MVADVHQETIVTDPRELDDTQVDSQRAAEGRAASGHPDWSKLFAGLTEVQRRDLREALAEHYAEEVSLAGKLVQHADGLRRYPDRRVQLLGIAAREEEHARWLREALECLGGQASERVPTPPDPRTNWERLIGDSEDERTVSERLLRDAFRVARDQPELARLLERIGEEERQHYRQLVWLLAHFTDRVTVDAPP